MILYDFKCADCSGLFEIPVSSMSAPSPQCPDCNGARLRRVPSPVNIGGSASAGIARENMPRSWSAVGRGDRSVVDGWRNAAIQRDKLEAKYPELGGDRRPVLAHEGIFANSPLRAGDPLPTVKATPKPS
jgi:putative FmdB family regulatory protein